MKQMKFVLLLTFMLSSQGKALPVESVHDEELDPELKGNFFEGDMIIDLTRNGVRDTSKRWPNAIVRYKLDTVLDVEHALHIVQGMKNIESVSCVRFLPAANNAKAYVKITGKATGCHAIVGYSGTNQNMNLQLHDINVGCFRIGTVMHELLHVLGFYHQHSVPDRDDYIKVVTENIIEGRESNFNKFSTAKVNDFDVKYDYGSVMHYSATAFSKNGRKTIIPLQGENIEIGQRRHLSEKDILKLNKMYKCSV